MVAATRSLDRGRVGQDAVDGAFRQDLTEFIDLQKRAGMDFYSDGLLRWQDIFRPLADAAGSKRPEALIRWFDTNTFFREPELSAELRTVAAPDGILPDSSVPGPRVLTLPSPFTFSRAARTDRDRNRLMIDLAQRVLRPLTQAAAEANCPVIHLEEPWLVYFGIKPEDWAPLEEALEIMHRGLAITVVFHLYFGDSAPHIDRLLRLPIDAIGVDLFETDVSALGSGWDKGLAAGVINGRSSLLEPVETTVEAARRIADRVRPRNLYLCSNSELEFLPAVVAAKKVLRLGEAARRLKELVSV